MERNDTKAANGIGPGAGKGARAEATERALRESREWRAAARIVNPLDPRSLVILRAAGFTK